MNKTINTQTLPGFLNGRGIGFERMFDMIDDAVAYTGNTAYPPYNLIKVSDDDFLIEFALAGFEIRDIEITQDGNKLLVAGTQRTTGDPRGAYLHNGISKRSFTREFVLAEYVGVVKADMLDGILTIKLHRELPDEMKPRQIEIKKLGK